MSWDDLLGDRVLMAIRTDVRHPFDPDASGVALDLGDLTVFVFEDPDDGYRSSAGAPLTAKASMYEYAGSPTYIRAPVTITAWGEHGTGIILTDRRNGKVVLRLGTDESDDYYPCFVCDWRPQDLADNAAA